MKNKINCFFALLLSFIILFSTFSEALTVSAEPQDAVITEKLVLKADAEYNDLTLDDAVLDLNGYKLTVYGDLNLPSGKIDINEGELTINGNLTMNSKFVSNSYSAPALKVGGGKLTVYGNYIINSGYRGENGLYMQNENDYVLVYGDFEYLCCGCSYNENIISAGVLEVKGNFNTPGGVDAKFTAKNSHTVILSGDKRQEISLGDYSRFSNIKIINHDIFFSEYAYVGKLQNDAIIDSVDDGISIDLNGRSLKVKDDFNLPAGCVDINNGNLTVSGDLIQSSSAKILLNGGKLFVYGNYTNDMPRNYGGGLYMNNNSDYMIVFGNFTYNSVACNVNNKVFTNGTLEVKGDFLVGWLCNFIASENHSVVFSGNTVQTIDMQSSSFSKFNTLVLTKDISQYKLINVKYNTLQYAYQTSDYHDSVFSNLVKFNKETQCAFHIYSNYDAPQGVSGATVTFNGVTKQTDQNGLVVFDRPSAPYGALQIKKPNYKDYINEKYYYDTETGCNYVNLIHINEKSYLGSATCNNYDVLSSAVRLDCSMDRPVYITVKGYSEYPIIKYTLMQDDKVIATCVAGDFVVNSKDFVAKKQVSVKVQNTAGRVSIYGININVYDSKAKDNSWPIINNVNIGGNLTIRIDDDVPVVGGMTVKVGSNTCPVSFNVSKDKIKIGINVPVDETTTYSSETLLNYLTYQEKDKRKDILTTGFAGYLECIFDENGNMIKTKGIGYLTFGYTGSYDFTTVIGVVPVTLGVQVTASAGITVSMIGYDFENSEFIFPELDWTATGAITAKVGVGIKYLSAGVYGNLTNNLSGEIFPDFDFKKWTISGELGLYGKIAIFEGKWPILKTGTLQVYPFEEAVTPEKALKSMNMLYSPAEYTLIGYTKALSNTLENYAIENGWVLDSDAYDYSEPQVVCCGDTKIMAYLDYDIQRPTANEQVLVYRVYDSENNKWGESITVDNNLTADAEFSLYSDGEGIYIVYTSAKEVLRSDIDINSYPENIEVFVSNFDFNNNVFLEPKQITDNNKFETIPTISVICGIPTVVWVENADNNIFCTNVSNTIKYSQFIDGNWTKTISVTDNLPLITDIAIGTVGTNDGISFICDADSDPVTANDKIIYLYDISKKSISSIAENDYLSDIAFYMIGEQNCLVWLQNNNIKYLSNTNTTASSVFESEISGLDNFRIIKSNENKSIILFLKNEKNSRNVYAIFGNLDSNEWGTPIRITSCESYLNAFDAYFDNNGLAVVYLNTVVKDINGVFETTSKLICESIENYQDIAIENIAIDNATMIPDDTTTAEITIKNNGYNDITSFSIILDDYNGNEIGRQNYTSLIKSGCSQKVDFEFKAPIDITDLNYQFVVISDNMQDNNTENNTILHYIWSSDLAVSAKQVIINGNNNISANIVNNGQLSTGGKIKIISATGDLIAEKPIKKLSFGESEEFLISLDYEGQIYYVVVETEQNDFNLLNNETALCIVEIDNPNGQEIICSHIYGDWISDDANSNIRYHICQICENKETIYLGDGNGDGKVDAQDLIVLRQALLTDAEYSNVLDANGDGVVDIRDLVRLKKHLASGTPLGKQESNTQTEQPVTEVASILENKKIA